MARLMRAFDWGATPLGPIDRWPAGLRSSVALLLRSEFPMFLAWGPQLRLFYNDAYLPILGAKHPAALGSPFEEMWGEIWPVLAPLVAGVLRGEASFEEDLLLVMRRHGFDEETYFTFSYSPVVDGEATGLFCACTETTGRVLGERRLRALQQLGEVSTTRSESIEQACVSMIDVLARQRADVPFALAYLFEPGTASTRLVASQGVVEGGAIAASAPAGDGVATWRLGASGSPLVVGELDSRFAGQFVPGANPAGDQDPDTAVVLPLAVAGQVEPVGLLVVGVSPYHALDAEYRGFLDLVALQLSGAVTDAQALAAERRQAEALAEIDRAKSEFFANVSHEFRTPLTLITGPTEEALADPGESEAARERWRVVRRNAGRLRRLVDDMLDFARIEAGRLQPEAAPADLAGLTRDIAESFAPAITRAGLALRVECPPLPGPVAVDADMWEKIVLNLLSNALKYTPEGSVAVRLGVAGDHAELTVADTGVGVPAAELPQLFQRFHRVRGTAGRSHEGAGIGLALVHELVRLHGGTVTADSTEGIGSTFTVRIPYDAPSPGAQPARPAAAAGGAIAPVYLEEALQWSAHGEDTAERAPGASAMVLVVDDNADLRRFVSRLLAAEWRVLQAADGPTALAIAREHHPDLVLSDVMMPGMNGFELLRELRADKATAAIPVVFLSARAGEEASIEGLDAGADDYLPKPFNAPELLARVRSNLALARYRNREADFRSALVNALHEGVAVLEADGTVVDVNDAFAMLTGYGAEGLPYRHPYPWAPGGDEDAASRETAEAAYASLLDEGRGELLAPIRHRDGHRRWLAATTTVVPDRPGHQGLSVTSARDVTSQRAAVEQEAIVAEFVAALATVTDQTALLETALVALHRLFGAARTVAALWTEGGEEPTIVGHPVVAAPGELGRHVLDALSDARHQGPPHVSVLRAPADSTAARGLAISPDADAALWMDFGAPRALTDRDRILFGLVTSHLGRALAHARSFAQARDVAVALQHAILGPLRLPHGFAARYQPAVRPLEVGGDWYDVVTLPEGRTVLVVGDCVGHGLRAAAVMGQLRSACQALLLRADGPAQVLAELDEFASRLPDARYTTVFCAILDPRAGSVRYSCAGHVPAVLATPGAGTRLLDEARSVPLAFEDRGERREAGAPLAPGATLLLYSDGLVERRRESLDVGIDRVRRELEDNPRLAPDELADRLMATQRPAAGYEDDVAVLVYRQPPDPLRLELPGMAERLAGMRKDLREWLASGGVTGEARDAVVLAVGEAASNAIEHARSADARPRLTVTAALRGGSIDVRVRDTGHWRPPGDPGNRGRGLAIMRAVMDDVAIDPGRPGTSVHMSRTLRR
jgi:PAS domain S-box-containing protein